MFVCLFARENKKHRGKKFQKLEKKTTVCRLFTRGGLLRNRLPLSRITTTARQRERETERQRDREAERKRDRETERQRDRETERHRET